MAFLFYAKHLLVLAAYLLVAAGAGTLVAGERAGLALRSALGLAISAHVLFFLGLIGQLQRGPILIWMAIAMLGLRRANIRFSPLLLAALPLFVLALFPPIAFDETLYHLPAVQAFADAGEMRFLPENRFPVFPQLHDLLCVPAFLFAGDTATHLVSLVETILTIALIIEWGRRNGMLAAALFAGGPIIVHLATTLYAEAALTLFVTAGFYCLDRARAGDSYWIALSGFFLGTACGVKYTGAYFAVAASIALLPARGEKVPGGRMRGRSFVLFTAATLAAALPTYARIFYYTGNPVFPFFGASDWALPLHDDASLPERLVRLVRVAWDVTFARDRVGQQPPFTPLLIVIVLVVLWASRRDRDTRFVALLCAGYAAIFTFLPPDSRYLVPLLPLLCIAAAQAVRSHARLLAAVAIVPALAYAGYCLHREGVPPATLAERHAYLERRIPEYRALARADGAPVYVCGAERLNYYGTTGDFNGPLSYARVLHPPNRELLGRFDYLLVSKRGCDTRVEGLTLVYEDEAAQLWRIESTR